MFENVYKCEVCGFKAKNKTGLKIHMKSTHKKIKNKYKCDSCDYSHERESQIATHNKSVHKKNIFFLNSVQT